MVAFRYDFGGHVSLFWPEAVSAVLILEDRTPVFHFLVVLGTLVEVMQYEINEAMGSVLFCTVMWTDCDAFSCH